MHPPAEELGPLALFVTHSSKVEFAEMLPLTSGVIVKALDTLDFTLYATWMSRVVDSVIVARYSGPSSSLLGLTCTPQSDILAEQSMPKGYGGPHGPSVAPQALTINCTLTRVPLLTP